MTATKKQKYLAILIVMMTLGTTWAIRGRFGHEYGAGWAGSIGVLAMVLVSGRKDWQKNWLPIMAIGAIGWGMTGMISYGQVVGYGRSGDWFNTSYGLLSLFVIGGLFGFLGGGLTGLILETTEEKKPDWATVVTQMVAGGIVFWGFLIHQLEWFMTPPRSELWAACLGAAFALAWYMRRHHFRNAWYVAMTTMLGAGFGFSFGNFLQTMGHGANIDINWWNVMEYSIGSFGGLGMAYGVFSRRWKPMTRLSSAGSGWAALFLFILIPLWIITNAFEMRNIQRMAGNAGLSDIESYSNSIYLQVVLVSALALIVLIYAWRKTRADTLNRKMIYIAFLGSFIWYQMLKLITSGIFGYYKLSMEELTVVNLVIVAAILGSPGMLKAPDSPKEAAVLDRRFYLLWVAVLIFLIVLAGITSGIFGDQAGSNMRFGGNGG